MELLLKHKITSAGLYFALALLLLASPDEYEETIAFDEFMLAVQGSVRDARRNPQE